MAQVITIAGERLFALKAQNNQQLDIDTFIFAFVPGQDSSAPIDRNEGLPPIGQRVHTQIVQQTGLINENAVVYSSVLDSLTGPFDFNWVGLYSSVNQTLIAIIHTPTVSKTVTVPGAAGNILNRNFVIEYSGIAELTGITVDPTTWQYDFEARLNGMDELTRQLAADMNGKDWFIDDGFKVVPRSTLNTFKVTAGVGYVSGLRVELTADHILALSSYPQFVYVDAWFEATSESIWKGKVAFTVTNTEMDDYIDVNGRNHYVFKLARITAADVVEDFRENGLVDNSGALTGNGLKSRNHYGGVIIGDNPIGVPGADWPSATALRDATTVTRKIVNELTDCHAFSDKSIIDTASDYGGYGAFDATTILRGDNTHNHVAAYQDRVQYQGDGILENSWGMIMWPTATGSGTIQKRVGVQVRGVSTTTAIIESNRGIDIDPKNSLNENIGVIVRNGVCANSPAISYNSAQDINGYTFYTSSFGKMRQQGSAGFGGASATAAPFKMNVSELGSTVVGSFSADSANGAFVAASGDSRVSFISNLSLLGYWDVIANSRAFSPATDNTQPNGQGIRRWSVIHAGTNAISTSDERSKSFLEIEQAEKDVAIKLKTMIRKFKLNESIKEKGDGARIHFGVSAQEVGQVFRDHGLDPHNYALFCHDSWDDQYVTEQINKGETVEITEIIHEQEFETVIEEFLELKVNEKGEEVYVSLSKEVTRPKTIEVPNGLDEEGKPKFKKLPVMKEVINKSTVMAEPIFEQRLETAKGDRYGIRYEQLLAFIISVY